MAFKQGNLATRLLLPLLLGLLFLSSGIAHAQSGELARTGKFYADSVSVESGEVWLGLYQIGDEYELRSTTLVVNEGVTVMGMDGKEVQTDQPTEPLFLVRGLEELQPGKVETMAHGEKFLFPGQTEGFRSRARSRIYYVLAAAGEAVYTYAGASITKYKLVLSESSLNRTQTLIEFDTGLDNAGPAVLWAGDLDRDGQVDLFMSMSRHYAYIDFALFLSSAAQDGKIVGQVATWGASID